MGLAYARPNYQDAGLSKLYSKVDIKTLTNSESVTLHVFYCDLKESHRLLRTYSIRTHTFSLGEKSLPVRVRELSSGEAEVEGKDLTTGRPGNSN